MPTKTANDSPALTFRSASYPRAWGDNIPKRVRLTRTVRPDFPLNMIMAYRDLVAEKDAEYEAWVNSHGAVSAIIDGEMLGLYPEEFEVIEWWGIPTGLAITRTELEEIKIEYKAGRYRPTMIARLLDEIERLQAEQDWLRDAYEMTRRNLHRTYDELDEAY